MSSPSVISVRVYDDMGHLMWTPVTRKVTEAIEEDLDKQVETHFETHGGYGYRFHNLRAGAAKNTTKVLKDGTRLEILWDLQPAHEFIA